MVFPYSPLALLILNVIIPITSIQTSELLLRININMQADVSPPDIHQTPAHVSVVVPNLNQSILG